MKTESIVILITCATLLVLVIYFIGVIQGYKHGQIDAVTDKMYWCLEKQDNSEFIWMYHSEGCKLGEANSVERKD